MPRELGAVAKVQLALWRTYARKWYYRLERRETDKGHRVPAVEQYHLVCGACGQSIMVVMSEGTGYLLTSERQLDEITRHLRNVHRDLEGEIYGRQSASAGNDPRGTCPSDCTSLDPSGLQAKRRFGGTV